MTDFEMNIVRKLEEIRNISSEVQQTFNTCMKTSWDKIVKKIEGLEKNCINPEDKNIEIMNLLRELNSLLERYNNDSTENQKYERLNILLEEINLIFDDINHQEKISPELLERKENLFNSINQYFEDVQKYYYIYQHLSYEFRVEPYQYLEASFNNILSTENNDQTPHVPTHTDLQKALNNVLLTEINNYYANKPNNKIPNENNYLAHQEDTKRFLKHQKKLLDLFHQSRTHILDAYRQYCTSRANLKTTSSHLEAITQQVCANHKLYENLLEKMSAHLSNYRDFLAVYRPQIRPQLAEKADRELQAYCRDTQNALHHIFNQFTEAQVRPDFLPSPANAIKALEAPHYITYASPSLS